MAFWNGGLKMDRKERLEILRERLKRLKVEMKFRHEDETLAFYLPLEDRVEIFLDIWIKDTFAWWQNIKKYVKLSFPKFVTKTLNRTYLHEFIHWASDEASDEQCEEMAVRLSFGEKFAKMLSELDD